MEFKAELLFKILGLGGLVAFINLLEFGDMIYQNTRGLSPLFEDIGAFILLGIIFFGVKLLKND